MDSAPSSLGRLPIRVIWCCLQGGNASLNLAKEHRKQMPKLTTAGARHVDEARSMAGCSKGMRRRENPRLSRFCRD
jgi:hypothetical protein